VEANLCRSFVCFLNIYITVGDREINYKSKGDVWEVNGQKVTGQKVTIYIFYPGGQKVTTYIFA
jgi:hypothetical protein